MQGAAASDAKQNASRGSSWGVGCFPSGNAKSTCDSSCEPAGSDFKSDTDFRAPCFQAAIPPAVELLMPSCEQRSGPLNLHCPTNQSHYLAKCIKADFDRYAQSVQGQPEQKGSLPIED